jgi:cytochrome c oxidase cbb3-type subunit 1
MTATPHISHAPGSPAGAVSEIDASARAPLAVLFGGAALWLVLASVFGLIASIKFHSPTFLADSAWLTYGRVYAVAKNALLYGFALQAAFGVVLWILAQLSERAVSQPWYILLGGKLWNLGVLAGVIGIFAATAPASTIWKCRTWPQ